MRSTLLNVSFLPAAAAEPGSSPTGRGADIRRPFASLSSGELPRHPSGAGDMYLSIGRQPWEGGLRLVRRGCSRAFADDTRQAGDAGPVNKAAVTQAPLNWLLESFLHCSEAAPNWLISIAWQCQRRGLGRSRRGCRGPQLEVVTGTTCW